MKYASSPYEESVNSYYFYSKSAGFAPPRVVVRE